MTTCFKNLVHHIHLSIRQLEELKKGVSWAQICPNKIEPGQTWASKVTLSIGFDPKV